ncbi:MAG: hypothetical protein R8G01_11605 [Ilumatobacteraceae bacterium]|nr:hypothetical protein [Ilumatobacteraceae bacterium]
MIELTPRHRRGVRWAVLWVGSVVGVVAMVGATAGLREAHLYRQRTNEGLKFELVGLLMFAANVLLLAAAASGARLSLPAPGARRRRGLAVVAGVIVAGVVIGDAFFLWVEWHGDRCIGSCG